jgi:hypothetical protein
MKMSSKLICPACGSYETSKVIAAGMPMKHCQECHTLWGEPWATIFTSLVAPLEGMVNGHFAFYLYEGNYFKALLNWLFAGSEEL